jgi:hypothetical protein
MTKLLGLVGWVLGLEISCFTVDGMGVDDFRLTGFRERWDEACTER